MKKALIWLILCLFSIPSFSRLLTLKRDFTVESTTPFEFTMDGSKGYGVLNVYTPIVEINNLRTPSPGSYNVTLRSWAGITGIKPKD